MVRVLSPIREAQASGGTFLNAFQERILPIAPNSPEARRLTLYDIGEIATTMWTLILHHGSATVEDAYDELRGEPVSPHVGPAAIELFRTWHPGARILDRVPSRSPSRKGATIALWGIRDG